MKKRKTFKKSAGMLISLLMLFFTLFSCRIPAQAAGLTLSLSASSVNIGDSVTATVTVPSGYGATISVSYDSSILEITSSAGNGGVMNLGDAMGYASSGSITFKAKSAGSCTISAVATVAGDAEANQVELTGASATVTVANAAASTGSTGSTGSAGASEGGSASEATASASGDNSLSSLTLSAGTLSPAFQYNTTKYTATVDYSVESIAISATPSNAKATVTSVTGNEHLSVGQNTIEIVVQAENGVTATYTITVTRKAEEESPQEEETESGESGVTGGDDRFVVNGISLLPLFEIPQESVPVDFVQETIVLAGTEYPCLSFQNGSLTLLYLAQEETEDGQLYVYDSAQDAVYPFVRIASEAGYVMVLLPGENIVPEEFLEKTLSIEGKGIVTAYRKASEQEEEEQGESYGFLELFAPMTVYAAEAEASDFYLLYCMNQAGEEGWYQYDIVEGTYQRYLSADIDAGAEAQENLQLGYEKLLEDYEQLQIKTKAMMYLFLGVIGLLLIVIVLLILTRKGAGKAVVFGGDEDEDALWDEDDEALEAQTFREEKKPEAEPEEKNSGKEEPEPEAEGSAFGREEPEKSKKKKKPQNKGGRHKEENSSDGGDMEFIDL